MATTGGRLRSLFHLGEFKTISDVADGLDAERAMWIGFDFGAERGDTAVHASVVDDYVVAPYAIENLIAR